MSINRLLRIKDFLRCINGPRLLFQDLRRVNYIVPLVAFCLISVETVYVDDNADSAVCTNKSDQVNDLSIYRAAVNFIAIHRGGVDQCSSFAMVRNFPCFNNYHSHHGPIYP